MTDALKSLLRDTPSQREPTLGKSEVVNYAGGYVFEVNDKTRLERFLILGSSGGTYYVNAKDQATSNIQFISDLIKRDESMVLETVVEISTAGRALRQTTTLFTYAMLLCTAQNKAAVAAKFNDVVRTATHLYEVCQYIDTLGGWGPAKRKAVAGWFTGKSPDALAFQAVKYRSRTV